MKETLTYGQYAYANEGEEKQLWRARFKVEFGRLVKHIILDQGHGKVIDFMWVDGKGEPIDWDYADTLVGTEGYQYYWYNKPTIGYRFGWEHK